MDPVQCWHTNRTEPKALFEAAETRPSGLVNRTIRFYRFRRQSETPPALDYGASPPVKRRLDGREARTTTTQGVMAAATGSNRRKERKVEKIRVKVNYFCFDCYDTSIGRDLHLYRQQDVAL
jgi:hypothetical protein